MTSLAKIIRGLIWGLGALFILLGSWGLRIWIGGLFDKASLKGNEFTANHLEFIIGLPLAFFIASLLTLIVLVAGMEKDDLPFIGSKGRRGLQLVCVWLVSFLFLVMCVRFLW